MLVYFTVVCKLMLCDISPAVEKAIIVPVLRCYFRTPVRNT
jgi:hypothetical protein